MSAIMTGPDGQQRCRWCAAAPAFIDYHDHEWGYPVTDDVRLFEKLCLEGFQSGLSWRTILMKRENFRAAFAHFEIDRVAAFGEADVARLLADAGIVRHRGKIEATITSFLLRTSTPPGATWIRFASNFRIASPTVSSRGAGLRNRSVMRRAVSDSAGEASSNS